MPPSLGRNPTTLFAVALAALLLAVYWQGLGGGFAFDDYGSIVGNAMLHCGSGAPNSWLDVARSGAAGPLGRGLSMLSFAFNYRFFGEDPLSFKLTNLLIHYANAMLVLVLSRQVLPLLYPSIDARRAQWAAMLACALWALHPMNAMPVLYIVQRMTSLSAFFMLAGVSLYLAGRCNPRPMGYAAIAVSILLCWPAAVLSKETGVLFAVYVVLCEWMLLRSFKDASKKILWLCGLSAGATLLCVMWASWSLIAWSYHVRDFDMRERLLTEARVLWFYVQQVIFPLPSKFGLYLDDIAVSRGLWSPPTTLLAIGGWIITVCIAWVKRTVWPGFAFSVFWYLGSHVLESTVVPLELAFEHRNYLASLGLLIWIAHAAVVWPKDSSQSWQPMALVLAFTTYCAFVTGLRATQWGDDFTRRQVEVFNHPLSARAHYEMAVGLQERTFEAGRGSGEVYKAVHDHLQQSAKLDPNSKVSVLALLYLNCIAQKPQDLEVLAELLRRLSTQKFTHMDRNVVQGLSPILVGNKLCLTPDNVNSVIAAGLSNPVVDDFLRASFYAVAMDYAIASLRDKDLALQFAKGAVAIAPNELAFSGNLIHLLLQSGQLEAAREEYSRLSIMPVARRNPAAVNQLKALIESAPSHATNPN